MVITFHGIGEPPRPVDAGEAVCWVPLEWFDAIVAAVPSDGRVPITFDDGNSSDLELALPGLIAAGHRAAFFVLAGKLGDPGFLTMDGVRQLRSAGMTIGSHGLHHRDWRRVDQGDLAREVGESSWLLSEGLGEPVDTAAIPFGSYDRRVLRAALGTYRQLFTSDGGSSRPSDSVVARTTIRTDRPLAHWIELVGRPGGRQSVRSSARRVAKRWR